MKRKRVSRKEFIDQFYAVFTPQQRRTVIQAIIKIIIGIILVASGYFLPHKV